VKGLYVRVTQNMLYSDEKTTELGEIIEGKNRKVKWKKEETMLLLCLTSTL